MSDSIFCYIYNPPGEYHPPGCYKKEISIGYSWEDYKAQISDYILKKKMDSPVWMCVKNRQGLSEFSFSTIQDFLDTYDLMV